MFIIDMVVWMVWTLSMGLCWRYLGKFDTPGSNTERDAAVVLKANLWDMLAWVCAIYLLQIRDGGWLGTGLMITSLCLMGPVVCLTRTGKSDDTALFVLMSWAGVGLWYVIFIVHVLITFKEAS